MNYILPISTSFSIISSILLFIINPGIVYSDGDIQNENEKIYCPACQFFYPKNNKKMRHCHICRVCISKMDHHCGVVGKCVGKYNLFIFITFVYSSASLMVSFYIILFNYIFKLFDK